MRQSNTGTLAKGSTQLKVSKGDQKRQQEVLSKINQIAEQRKAKDKTDGKVSFYREATDDDSTDTASFSLMSAECSPSTSS